MSSTWTACRRRSRSRRAGGRIAAGTSKGDLHLRAGPGSEAVTLSDEAYNPLWDVSFSPAGRLLATVANDGDALLWEVASGQVRNRFQGKLHRRVAVAFTPDGIGIALAGPRHAPQIRDLDGHHVRLTLDRPAGRTKALAVSPDGRRLVTVDKDRRVRLWDVTDGKLRHKVEASADRAVFAPDGETIALVGSDCVTMWHPASRGLSTAFRDGDGGSRLGEAIAFSPGGRLAAAPADLDKVLIWDRGTGRVVRTLSEVDSACAVAFSPVRWPARRRPFRRRTPRLRRCDRRPAARADRPLCRSHSARLRPGRHHPGHRLRRRCRPHLEHRHRSTALDIRPVSLRRQPVPVSTACSPASAAGPAVVRPRSLKIICSLAGDSDGEGGRYG